MSEADTVLRINGLAKSYRTPEGDVKQVVSVGEFSMAAGKQLGLKGESGSGKTTFLNLIAGIVKPDTGSIKIAGQEMTVLTESQRDRFRATTIGCVYQSFNL